MLGERPIRAEREDAQHGEEAAAETVGSAEGPSESDCDGEEGGTTGANCVSRKGLPERDSADECGDERACGEDGVHECVLRTRSGGLFRRADGAAGRSLLWLLPEL